LIICGPSSVLVDFATSDGNKRVGYMSDPKKKVWERAVKRWMNVCRWLLCGDCWRTMG